MTAGFRFGIALSLAGTSVSVEAGPYYTASIDADGKNSLCPNHTGGTALDFGVDGTFTISTPQLQGTIEVDPFAFSEVNLFGPDGAE